MAKIPAPIAQTARLIDLVPFLISHQGISLKKLASEFGVSEKEMLNDLNTLWMCGLPGYTPLELIDLEFESGYVSIRNAEVLNKVRALDSSEVISLLLGLSLLESSLEESAHLEAIQSLRAKLVAISGDVASVKPQATSGLITLAKEAIAKRCDLIFDYHSLSRDVISERTVTPYEVYSEGAKSYMRGFCRTSGSQRTFSFDRTSNLRLGDGSARNGSDLEKNLEESQIAVELLAKGRDREVLETFQAIPKGGGLYKTVIFNPFWLTRSVASFSGDVELVSPPSIRSEVVDMASRTLELYQ